MLTTLLSIATQQANPTENTTKKVKLFLDYTATHPNAIVTFRASDMIIVVNSNTLYLSETKGHSRAGGHFHVRKHRKYGQQWGYPHN